MTPRRKTRTQLTPALPIEHIQRGDILVDPLGHHFIVADITTDDAGGYFVLRPTGAREHSDLSPYLTFDEFDTQQWTHLPGKEVNDMAKATTPRGSARHGLPTPPKMTRAEWLKRDKTTVTLTRAELEQLSQLLAAGHVLIRDGKSISPKLKAAMTKLGVPTKGL